MFYILHRAHQKPPEHYCDMHSVQYAQMLVPPSTHRPYGTRVLP